jgi:hypothetical protein
MVSILNDAVEKIDSQITFLGFNSRHNRGLRPIRQIAASLEALDKLPNDMAETLADIEAREAYAAAQEDSRDE